MGETAGRIQGWNYSFLLGPSETVRSHSVLNGNKMLADFQIAIGVESTNEILCGLKLVHKGHWNLGE